ncbi:tRNA (cytosine(38)-C(5))-methyltransferase [Smittium mucronatum]|uniref:tRNA (cytosine(38)-C(5))-methyltransferase n=1 Tax=Smittium mucronatum TaxID=133383 RepID=A0A1R0GTJ8_9FUNG|nr:tRNA (cytosine(38)-C(5))-methyltransferase [Smittium mucronatum]
MLEKPDQVDSIELLDIIKSLNLRFFSPNEMAQFLCFPVPNPNPNNKYQPSNNELGDSPLVRLQFPKSITVRQQYQLLGNSVNVAVISCLLHYLFFDF